MLTSNTVGTNVQLFEQLGVNLNTNHINICSVFQGSNKKKLKVIDENL